MANASDNFTAILTLADQESAEKLGSYSTQESKLSLFGAVNCFKQNGFEVEIPELSLAEKQNTIVVNGETISIVGFDGLICNPMPQNDLKFPVFVSHISSISEAKYYLLVEDFAKEETGEIGITLNYYCKNIVDSVQHSYDDLINLGIYQFDKNCEDLFEILRAN
jgi:hypothetical protein